MGNLRLTVQNTGDDNMHIREGILFAADAVDIQLLLSSFVDNI